MCGKSRLFIALAVLLVAACEGPFPKVVVKLGEGDTTAADSLRPFMIASDDAEATAAGALLLRAGGTAGDAAAAMALTLAVTLPSSASLHARGVCLVHDAARGETSALDFTNLDSFGLARAARTVQGTLGTLPWTRIAAPAANLARFGHPVSRLLAARLAEADVLLNDAATLTQFMSPRRRLLGAGEILRQPALAAALDKLRAQPRGAVADMLTWRKADAEDRGGVRRFTAAAEGPGAGAGATAFVAGDTKGTAVACAVSLGQAFGRGVMVDGALAPDPRPGPLRASLAADPKGRVVEASAAGGAAPDALVNSFVCRLDNSAPQCEAKADARAGGYALTGQGEK